MLNRDIQFAGINTGILLNDTEHQKLRTELPGLIQQRKALVRRLYEIEVKIIIMVLILKRVDTTKMKSLGTWMKFYLGSGIYL